MTKEASKHNFKPEINAVSKMIVENKESVETTLNRSASSDLSIEKNLVNLSVHEKLYLSRNNSHGLLQNQYKSCINKNKKGLDSRSNSVSDLKTY